MVDKNCKYFRSEPDLTPNNYDIYINPEEIPKNIKQEKASQLTKRLNKLMPLSKTIHLNYTQPPRSREEKNNFRIHTKLKINNKEVKFI